MPPRTLLSSEQRTRLFAIPTDPAEMARHYVLGAEDLALIRTKRRAINRLGFAIQLCLLRIPASAWDQPTTAGADDRLRGQSDSVCRSATFADYARGIRPAASTASNLQRYLRFGVSGSPIGGPVCRLARMPHGPRIAASPSSRR